MNDESPPKRITRARAAAKTDTGVKIATAASKAKVARTASTTKRKTRADDVHDDDELNEPQNETIEPELPKVTRGRAKKAAAVHQDEEPNNETIEPELPKTTRGRAKKAAAVQPDPEPEMEDEPPAPARSIRGRPKKVAVEAPAPELTRATRGRGKKADVPEEEAVAVVEEPPKKPTRTRAATISKASVPRKIVKFEEPDKENIVPPPANMKGKTKAGEAGAGLKAKPVRKPAATTTRGTRGRAKVEEKEQKSSPLSPKKATQVATAKDHSSDDELAINEKTPMKPLMKSPVKAPGSVFGTAKKLGFSNSVIVHRAVGQDLSRSIMGSPARRPPQSVFKESLKTSPQRSNLGASLMKSPFKLPLPQSKPAETGSGSSFKVSLLQSPARRPQSPTKVSEHGSPSRSRSTNPMISGATPQTSTFKISRFATPRTLMKSAMRPGQMLPPSAIKNVSTGSPKAQPEVSELDELSAPSLIFSGRLSSIMPREVDPVLSTSESIVEEHEGPSTIKVETTGDPMVVDGMGQTAEEVMYDQATAPICSPPRNSTGAFALRDIDENPFMDSDSEDELASVSPKYSPSPMNLFASSTATPTPFTTLNKTPKTAATQKPTSKDRSLPRSQIGFTPLARQLSNWMASSPNKSEQSGSDTETARPAAATPRSASNAHVDGHAEPSPAKSTFFEDEMSVRDEMLSAPEPELSNDAIIDEQNFTPIEVVDEDLALAEEADEMSMLETGYIEDVEDIEDAMDLLINTGREVSELLQVGGIEEIAQTPVEVNRNVSEFVVGEAMGGSEELPFTAQEATGENSSNDVEEETQIRAINEITPSEASQEYGDENAFPIDPVLLALSGPRVPSTPTYKTPKRVLAERVCHTVSKVPLKAVAEDSTLRPPLMKRSASVSRLPPPRPSSNHVRSNTVISYSPTKSARRAHPQPQPEQEDVIMEDAYATPSKSDALWSNIGTPAHTPRRDPNTALLKGAVVFVDVRTSEGADASSLFTELLTQMGARCVKSWNWNPNSEDGSKIGITHVVFKDGGKRTLGKAKETGGVVTCVGVGWVLEYVISEITNCSHTNINIVVKERTNGSQSHPTPWTQPSSLAAGTAGARAWNLVHSQTSMALSFPQRLQQPENPCPQ